MKKAKLMEKIYKHFWGIEGPIDEYRRQELNRIGSNAYMITFWLQAPIFLAGFLASDQWTLFATTRIFMIGAMIELYIPLIYISIQMRKLHLHDNEVSQEKLHTAKIATWRRAIFSGILFGVLFLAYATIDRGRSIDNYWLEVFVPSILAMVVYMILVGFVELRRIKVVDDDEK